MPAVRFAHASNNANPISQLIFPLPNFAPSSNIRLQLHQSVYRNTIHEDYDSESSL